MMYAQLAGSWAISNGCPPIRMLPLLGSGPVFAATVKFTVPFPVPVWPLVIVIHAESDVAERSQVVPLAVTVTEPVPPLTPKLAPGVENVSVQSADWLTVKF